MMKKMLWVSTIVAMLAGCGGKGDKVSIDETMRVLPLNIASSCTELIVSGDWCIEMNDSVQQPTIMIDENLMKYVTIDRGDWKLKLKSKPRMAAMIKNYSMPCLQLPLDCGFKKITIRGATELSCEGKMVGEKLKLKMSGSAKVKVDSMNFVDDVDIVMSGATVLRCQLVKMANLDIEMSGSSDARVEALRIEKEVDVEMSGASNLDLNCEVLSLKLDMSGSSKLNLKGKTVELNASLSGTSGVGNFEEKEAVTSNNLFIADVAKVGISGNATLRLQCNDRLKVNASGSSNVLYKGSPKVELKSSGAARVEAT